MKSTQPKGDPFYAVGPSRMTVVFAIICDGFDRMANGELEAGGVDGSLLPCAVKVAVANTHC
jgi:hypothetical protein